ncbi:MAG: hypothetical protein LBQ41_00650 [Candidatus Ancillula sp.]|jgi:hypothetical protein|nr:hypothetical protein [Candidatus Ancillula sp.]
MNCEDEYKFTRDELIALLKEVDWRMRDAGIEETVYIVGGAAMSLSFNKDRTSDVDGHYSTTSPIQKITDQIADERGFSKHWFNNSINQTLVYFEPDDDKRTLFIGNNLNIEFASPQYVLAMKLAARRDKDISDVRILIDVLGLKNKSEVVEIVRRYFRADLSDGSYQMDQIDEFLDVVYNKTGASNEIEESESK